jgi:protein SCO1/2
MSVSRLAWLQKELEAEGLARDVRLLALTFEPAFDTPTRLKRFVQNRGFVPSAHAIAARLQEPGHEVLLHDLDIPVSYSAGWVNTHGVEAVLLDGDGRLTRKYTATWDVPMVVADVRTLLAER